MKSLLVLILLLLPIVAVPAEACFGPKLYLGVPDGRREAAIAALVCLYVKEKTGIETVQVPVPVDRAIAGLHEETLDMVLAVAPTAEFSTVMRVPGGPVLISGSRPLDDLQFTTLVPALTKLEQLLTETLMERLLGAVAAGNSPAAAARQLMTERRWI